MVAAQIVVGDAVQRRKPKVVKIRKIRVLVPSTLRLGGVIELVQRLVGRGKIDTMGARRAAW